MNEAEKIREELKKIGITSRQVSVKHHYSMYDGIVYIKIKDITIKKRTIEEIARKFEEVRYDEHCGEILQGANTFIEISYDYDAFEKYKEEHHLNEKAQEIYNMGQYRRNENHQIIAGDPRFIFNIGENLLLIHENENGRYIWKHWNLNGIYGIAKTLLHYELGHYEPLAEFQAWEIEEEKRLEELYKQQEIERAKQEEERKQWQINRDIMKNKINETSTFEAIPEEKQTIATYLWAHLNKNNTIKEYQEEIEQAQYKRTKGKTTHRWNFTDYNALQFFKNSLLTDYEQLQGLGGSYSDDPRLDAYEELHKIPLDIMQSVEWLRLVVEITFNNELQFVVDPQGHSYARYVGLLEM